MSGSPMEATVAQQEARDKNGVQLAPPGGFPPRGAGQGDLGLCEEGGRCPSPFTDPNQKPAHVRGACPGHVRSE